MKFIIYVTLGMIVGGLVSLLFGVPSKTMATGIFFEISLVVAIWGNLKLAGGTLVFKENE